MMSCEPRQLDPVRRTDLVENVRKMPLYGVRADGNPVAYFLVGFSLQHRSQDFQLAPGQPELFRAPARRLELLHARGDIRDALVSDPVVARHDALDAVEQHV